MPPYLRPVLVVIAGTALLQFGHTVFGVLLPLELAGRGVPAALVGLLASAYGAGFLLGCFRAHAIVRAVGHIRAFAALAASCASLSLAYLVSAEPLFWLPLRFAQGFCLAGLFATAEGWLGAMTPSTERGRVMSTYLVAVKMTVVGAQLLLAGGSLSAAAFMVLASASFSLALVPVALTRSPAPPPLALKLLDLRDLIRIAPAAMLGCIGVGLLNGAVGSLVPVYGARVGLSPALTVSLLTMMQVGSLLLQWPLGWLSDHVDRRAVMALCAFGVMALSLAVGVAGPTEPWAIAALFLGWGAFSMSIYGIAAAHAADFAEPDQMVAVSSGVLFCWAIGSAVGPLVAAPAMDLVGPSGLFHYAAIVAGAMGAYVLWRKTRRRPLPPEERAGFVNIPATSPAVARIDPRLPSPPRAPSPGEGATLQAGRP